MKKLFLPLLVFCFFALLFSCGKKNSYDDSIDYTKGIPGTRSFSLKSNGNLYADTIVDSVHTMWPEAYNRTVSDTTLTITKYDGFGINIYGMRLRYRSTDLVAHIIKFDSTIPGSGATQLLYYYMLDSMTFEFNHLIELHVPSGKMFETHDFLHTK